MRLSIRWRLTLWNTLALACVLLLFGGVVYWLLNHIHQDIQQGLQERVNQSLRRIDQTLSQLLGQLQRDDKIHDDAVPRIKHWIFEFKEHNSVFCVVYDNAGEVFLRTEEMAVASIPTAPTTMPREPEFHDATIPILNRQRVLHDGLRIGDQQYAVVLMASLEDIDRERTQVLREQADVAQDFRSVATILLSCIPVALVVVAGVGYLLARKALSPVDQLNRMAESITVRHLDRRLPVAHPNDELGRLATTINEMMARLERSFQEIQRFTADASHELRTPLTAIRTETEVALAKPLTLEEHQHLLASIMEECERLTKLTDQLLTLAREDAAGARRLRRPVDLVDVVQGVTETMKPLIEAKGLRFQLIVHGPLTVEGDETHLRQVFINLLDNAVKYTPHGGAIVVELEQKEDKALVSFKDSGIGVSPEHQRSVFDRFYRVDKARSRAEGGTGLGLSIALSIVQSHEGYITLASEPGKGTTVVVVLDLLRM